MRVLSDPDFDALVAAGHDVLRVFPEMPGACVMMSALLAGRLQDLGHRFARLIGGALAIGPDVVFGRTARAVAFSATDLDWDGHAWVQFGGYITDVSLVQTDYSPQAPRALARHATGLRKPNQRLYIATPDGAREDGLDYVAQHVLSREQVDLLFKSALTLLPRI